MLVHEGAPAPTAPIATDSGLDFGDIINGVNDNIDAIVSGTPTWPTTAPSRSPAGRAAR